MCLCGVCVVCVCICCTLHRGVSLCILVLGGVCVCCMFCWLWFMRLAADTGVQLLDRCHITELSNNKPKEPCKIGHRCN